MEHTKILKRAWHILWQYRVLWLFGFILALTTASYGTPRTTYNVNSNDFNRDRSRYRLEELDPELQKDLEEAIEGIAKLFTEGIPPDVGNTFIAIGIGLILFILVLVILGKIFRYTSEAALIRMVDEYEETEAKQSIGNGFRLGWSRITWRLFLIDLTIDLPLILVFLVLLALALSPLWLWISGKEALGAVGTVAAIGFFFLLILLGVVAGLILSLLKPFFRRACALDGTSVIASIRKGYFMVRRNLKDVGIMWLILLGIKIAWSVLMIPLGLLVFFLGVLLGGATAFAAGGVAGLYWEGLLPWIIAIAVGLPIFLAVVVLPIGFVNGLRETFISSSWTLTYREVKSLPRLEIKELPDLGPPL